MASSERVAFYQYLYDAEWTRRAELRQATALPAGVLTLLATVWVYYARAYHPQTGVLSILLLVSLVGIALAWGLALGMLARSLFGPVYRRLPWPSDVFKFEEGLRSYYAHAPEGPGAETAEFNAFLIENLIEAANRNSENNVNSGEFLYKANRAVAVGLVFVALGAVPVVLATRRVQPTPGAEVVNIRQEFYHGKDRIRGPERTGASSPTPCADKAGRATEH